MPIFVEILRKSALNLQKKCGKPRLLHIFLASCSEIPNNSIHIQLTILTDVFDMFNHITARSLILLSHLLLRLLRLKENQSRELTLLMWSSNSADLMPIFIEKQLNLFPKYV